MLAKQGLSQNYPIKGLEIWNNLKTVAVSARSGPSIIGRERKLMVNNYLICLCYMPGPPTRHLISWDLTALQLFLYRLVDSNNKRSHVNKPIPILSLES